MTINNNEDFRSRFNSDWASKLIIAVDEVLLDKREDSERLKNLSTAKSYKTEAKGKDIANPLASVLSAAMLLKHLGLHEEADAIERAVEKSIALGITTDDIKRKNQFSASTSKVGDFIADYITNQDDSNMNFKNIHMGQSTII